ncbi:putative pentatricopeptide repeat-containing protein At1g03510 [Rosa rugosa]|uniref:putative pentatricopeptide repeat-containing protein At1g03510 n=1 Tax=Rosa rugosa TaxID=74645 RepID=UPI002B4127AA|nr:putative pentatricopeptide repeat-containing protein At1g03510 [Rosa rugosa]
MHRESIPIDTFSIKGTLKSCVKLKNHAHIQQLHSHIVKLGFRSDPYVASFLLKSYFVVSSAEHAHQLFDEMPRKNTAAWNAMLSGYKSLGDVEKARSVFDQMKPLGVESWSCMIDSYVKNGDNERGVMLFRNMMIEEGIKPDIVTLLPVLSICADMGPCGLLLGKSFHGFVRPGCWHFCMQERDLKTWNMHFCRTVQKGYTKGPLYVFENLQKASVRPNELTFKEVLNASVHSGLVKEGREYFKLIEGCGLKSSIQHYRSMVQLYSNARQVEEAYKVIKNMKLESDVVVWSSLLSACEKHRQFGMAERVAKEIMKTVKPDNKSRVQLHSLVQLYSNAYKVIKNIKVEPDVEAWSSFLSACKEHKQFGMAERVAREVMKTVKPDSKHGARLHPLIQLYSNAGLLEEAYKVINDMKLKPYVASWISFLSACKEHKQFGMAKRIAETVMMTVKPDSKHGAPLHSHILDMRDLRKSMANPNLGKIHDLLQIFDEDQGAICFDAR